MKTVNGTLYFFKIGNAFLYSVSSASSNDKNTAFFGNVPFSLHSINSSNVKIYIYYQVIILCFLQNVFHQLNI